jgi:CelD/BcsL family acetyltransferase involved in cellulose biosynthesis
LRIVLLREIPEESSLQRGWNDLAVQMERPQVFYTCEWALAVQSAFKSAFKPPPKPLLFLGFDGEKLVGAACLSVDIGEQNVSFLAGSTADYCDFLSHPQRRFEFVEGVFAELNRLKVSSLVLANLPADSATPAALQASAKKHGFHLYIRPAYLCPQVELDSEAQRRELRTTVMRKRQLRKCLRALEREGPVTTAYLRSWAQIEAALPGFVDAHVARFRAMGRVSFLLAPERRLLLEELARRFSGTGVVTLSRLTVGERPVAWSYGFQFHGSWFLYQTTFDARFEENSPGYCLLAKIVIEACETSTLRRVDLGLGSEVYKEWFANGTRETRHATITTSPVRHLAEMARYRVATEVKSFPKLEAAIRSARSRFGL